MNHSKLPIIKSLIKLNQKREAVFQLKLLCKEMMGEGIENNGLTNAIMFIEVLRQPEEALKQIDLTEEYLDVFCFSKLPWHKFLEKKEGTRL